MSVDGGTVGRQLGQSELIVPVMILVVVFGSSVLV